MGPSDDLPPRVSVGACIASGDRRISPRGTLTVTAMVAWGDNNQGAQAGGFLTLPLRAAPPPLASPRSVTDVGGRQSRASQQPLTRYRVPLRIGNTGQGSRTLTSEPGRLPVSTSVGMPRPDIVKALCRVEKAALSKKHAI